MKIKEALKKANQILIQNNIDEVFFKSRILLAHILNVEKEYLIIHDDEVLLSLQENEFFEKVNKLCSGVPIQYLTNSQEFMGVNFYVDKNVLIPQPDTEILVENVISIIKNLQKSCQKEITVLDLCTGSGIIGVCLKKYLQNVNVLSSDISSNALEIAKKNANLQNVKIDFIKSDLFENIDEKFDVIVSNPPYIKTDKINELSKEVKNEPRLALDGGQDGLDFYRRIIKESTNFFRKTGYLALEIGYDQKEAVENLFKNFKYKEIKIFKDLSDIERVIIGKYENI